MLDRKLLMNTLKKGGFENEILQAANGEDGLKILGDQYSSICLILLDWQMPVMDGIGFMKGIIRVPEVSSIPVVLITASGSDENKKQAREINPGLAGYLVKPYKPNELIELVKPFVK
ncbi:MAG TPA: two-component system response regulator [Candidatus Omnitrophica bacterium]|nr:two-component system response regulator [Candidatus Omnitrophota bacterium]